VFAFGGEIRSRSTLLVVNEGGQRRRARARLRAPRPPPTGDRGRKPGEAPRLSRLARTPGLIGALIAISIFIHAARAARFDGFLARTATPYAALISRPEVRAGGPTASSSCRGG